MSLENPKSPDRQFTSSLGDIVCRDDVTDLVKLWGLKTGDLLLFSGTGFSSRMVKLFTHSHISHAGKYFLFPPFCETIAVLPSISYR